MLRANLKSKKWQNLKNQFTLIIYLVVSPVLEKEAKQGHHHLSHGERDLRRLLFLRKIYPGEPLYFARVPFSCRYIYQNMWFPFVYPVYCMCLTLKASLTNYFLNCMFFPNSLARALTLMSTPIGILNLTETTSTLIMKAAEKPKEKKPPTMRRAKKVLEMRV